LITVFNPIVIIWKKKLWNDGNTVFLSLQYCTFRISVDSVRR
jgi:hypothetical protein